MNLKILNKHDKLKKKSKLNNSVELNRKRKEK